MEKIKELLNKGWQVDLRKEIGGGYSLYTVWAEHVLWGGVSTEDEDFNQAVEIAYNEAKELESVWS